MLVDCCMAAEAANCKIGLQMFYQEGEAPKMLSQALSQGLATAYVRSTQYAPTVYGTACGNVGYRSVAYAQIDDIFILDHEASGSSAPKRCADTPWIPVNLTDA